LPETIALLEAAAIVLEGTDAYLQVWLDTRADMTGEVMAAQADVAAELSAERGHKTREYG
jgi:hypothetical protein